MRAIAATLGVSRSNLIERRQRRYFVRRRRCVDDTDVTARIKKVVDARPTYGYLRGGGALIVDSTGKRRISIDDLAIAIVDELKKPKEIRQRYILVSYRSS
jgi:putative NADH-flavin reductase